MLTAGSLFSGIGGIDLAFSLAGFDIRFQVEIDEYCRKVLAKHAQTYWHNATQFADVRDVGSHNLTSVDVLAGGFPCQDISGAGKRAGIREGTRSGLWLEFKRIISEIRPRAVLLENVAAITIRDGYLVIADLAELGYSTQWGIISAADAGAPHKRERWFCVGYPEVIRDKQNSGTMAETQVITQTQNDGRIVSCTGQDVGNTNSVSAQGYGTIGQQIPSMGFRPSESQGTSGKHVNRQDLSKSRLGGDAYGVSTGLDGVGLMVHQFPSPPGYQHSFEPERTSAKRSEKRIKALGNAVVPQVVYPIALELHKYLSEG